MGGPIQRERMFFFLSVEPIIVRSSASSTYIVPTTDLVSISSPGTQAIFQRFPLPPSSHTGVRDDEICPYKVECDPKTRVGYENIPAYELAFRNGPRDAGAGSPQNTVLGTGRFDWIVDSRTQFFIRYALQNADIFAVALQPYSQELDQTQATRNQNITLNLTRTWSHNLATEGRLVYGRIGSYAPLAPIVPFPSFSFIASNASLPSGSDPSGGPQNFYQVFQNAIWTRGKHSIKLGGQFLHLRDNRQIGVHEVPQAFFLDSQAFVDGSMMFYAIAIDAKGNYPGELIDPPVGPAHFKRHYHYNEAAAFVTDTWRATRRLSVTPGFRWEYFGVPHSPGTEQQNDSSFYLGPGSSYLSQIANGRILRTVDAPGDLRGMYYRPDYKDFAPRLGLAYDLSGDGRAVFRSGIGVFNSRIDGFELFAVAQNPPGFADTVLQDVTLTPQTLANLYSVFPDQPFPLIDTFSRAPAENLRPAYAISWNVTFERELANRFLAGVSYLGASGNRLYSKNNVNRSGSAGLLDPNCVGVRYASDDTTRIGPDYSKCQPLNPLLSTVAIRGNLDHSSYNALQLKLDSRTLSHWGAQFGVNYTWSHSIDDSSSSNGDDFTGNSTGPWPLDAFDASRDRGSSDFDQRHRIAANFIWQIPFAARSNNWVMRSFLSGWSLAGLFSYQTGQPFSIADSGVPDQSNEHSRPRLVSSAPRIRRTHARPGNP